MNYRMCAPALIAAATLVSAFQSASAQDVDALVATGLREHPSIRAAEARVIAASARVRPAGALPDPMLMAGLENQPLGKEAHEPGPDMMTMKMLGVSQTLPYPGKLAAARRAAEQDVLVAQSRVDAARTVVVRDIKQSYYELAYLDEAMRALEQSREIFVSMQRAAQARYVAGAGEQRAVLDARVEAARIEERILALAEQKRSEAARLLAALGGSGPEPPTANLPRATPALPPVAELQERAARTNPELRARNAEIAAQMVRAELARKQSLPDFDLSLRYGQRDQRPDMISFSVAVPIPIQKSRKQDEQVLEADAEAEALRGELIAETNRIRAEVARLHAELERTRAQLVLFANSIIPQAQAALESAKASLVSSRVDLYSILERQQALLEYQLAHQRLLADFARKLAELDSVVGQEVLP
ncbi:MAG: TolC family protein [Gemmatimonadota bacterium]